MTRLAWTGQPVRSVRGTETSRRRATSRAPPATIVRTGSIAVGKKADLVVIAGDLSYASDLVKLVRDEVNGQVAKLVVR